MVKITKGDPENWGSELTQLMNPSNFFEYTKVAAFLGSKLSEDTGQNIQITTPADYM